MSSYRINYEQLRLSPGISDMLSALERGFTKFGIDFYLVGAVARDVWMNGIHHIAPRRTTGDIDFAILVNGKGVYEELKEYLVETEKFRPNTQNAFVLLWKDGTEIDLMPFGAIEDTDRKVTVQGTGFTTMDVPGLSEIYAGGLPQMDLDGKNNFKCCTLPGIILLKLLAWDDRPEIRQDDILDISDILANFFSMHDAEIWENHADLFVNEEDDLLHIAAQVMGREAGEIASQDRALFERIQSILGTGAGDPRHSRMAALMARYFENTLEENTLVIKKLLDGFNEKSPQ